jgi:hypothetical protein
VDTIPPPTTPPPFFFGWITVAPVGALAFPPCLPIILSPYAGICLETDPDMTGLPVPVKPASNRCIGGGDGITSF